eukprot:8201060-Alexandrium_andersonii.AAC.1
MQAIAERERANTLTTAIRASPAYAKFKTLTCKRKLIELDRQVRKIRRGTGVAGTLRVVPKRFEQCSKQKIAPASGTMDWVALLAAHRNRLTHALNGNTTNDVHRPPHLEDGNRSGRQAHH